MALQVDFDVDGIVYNDAYLRIQTVRSAVVDYEKFETSESDGSERLVWVSRMESYATVYVWSDAGARANRAQPIKWFTFQYEYDIAHPDNAFKQAYIALKSSNDFANAIDI